jgi:hypothetical protein
MMALGIVRAGEWIETEVDQIQQYCRTQGWHLAERLLWVEGTPELGPLVARVREIGANRVLLTRTVLTELEDAYPNLWATTRARLERRGVIAVGV